MSPPVGLILCPGCAVRYHVTSCRPYYPFWLCSRIEALPIYPSICPGYTIRYNVISCSYLPCCIFPGCTVQDHVTSYLPQFCPVVLHEILNRLLASDLSYYLFWLCWMKSNHLLSAQLSVLVVLHYLLPPTCRITCPDCAVRYATSCLIMCPGCAVRYHLTSCSTISCHRLLASYLPYYLFWFCCPILCHLLSVLLSSCHLLSVLLSVLYDIMSLSICLVYKRLLLVCDIIQYVLDFCLVYFFFSSYFFFFISPSFHFLVSLLFSRSVVSAGLDMPVAQRPRALDQDLLRKLSAVLSLGLVFEQGLITELMETKRRSPCTTGLCT